MRNLCFLLLVFIFSGCAIEEAQPQQDKQLTLVHNYLSKDQKKVLLKIAKRRNIELRIKALSEQEIRKALLKNPWEPGFDMILLGNLMSQKALQNIKFQYHESDFGCIPVGVSYLPDSVVKVRHFKDLSAHYLWAPADKYAENILKANLAYVYRNRDNDKKQNKAFKDFLRGLRDHRLAYDNYQLQNTLLLCRYDTYLNLLKPKVSARQFTYALKNKQLFYKDYVSLFIVSQSTHYTNARKFVRYLHFLRDNNAKFRKAFGFTKNPTQRKQPTVKALLDFLEKWHLNDILSAAVA